MDKVQFGQLIQLLRKKNELSQKDLAAALHVTPPSVCKWEQGKALPDICMIENIATYFNLSYDELYNPKETIRRILSNESKQADTPTPKKVKRILIPTISAIVFVAILVLIYAHFKSPFTPLSSEFILHETLGYTYLMEYSISSEQDEYRIMEHAKQTVADQTASYYVADNADAILILYYFDYRNKDNHSAPDYEYCHIME